MSREGGGQDERGAQVASAPARRRRRWAVLEYEVRDGEPVGTLLLDMRMTDIAGFVDLAHALTRQALSLAPADEPSERQQGFVAPPLRSGGSEARSLSLLTPKEQAIAEAAAGGASNRAIAEMTFYSVKSVEAYLTRIYRKLGISGRPELGAMFVEAERQVAA